MLVFVTENMKQSLANMPSIEEIGIKERIHLIFRRLYVLYFGDPGSLTGQVMREGAGRGDTS